MLISELAKLGAHGRLTLPRAIREAACLHEGEDLVIEIVAEGILISRKWDIERSQAWFWTPEWQEGEKEVDAEIAAGHGPIYYTGEEFLAALDEMIEEGHPPTVATQAMIEES